MNAEKQRIAIAEACGWTCEKNVLFSGGVRRDVWRSPAGGVAKQDFGKTVDFLPPDYLTDLNAMHEAEKVLTDEQQSDYGERLASLVPYNGRSVHRDIFRMAHATAAQRAEAFLRTIGKWEESE